MMNGVRPMVNIHDRRRPLCYEYDLITENFLGDIIYFNILGQHFIILSDLKTTTDLFEKRSSNYSDRMRMPMVVELYVSNSFHLKKDTCQILCLLSEWAGM